MRPVHCIKFGKESWYRIWLLKELWFADSVAMVT